MTIVTVIPAKHVVTKSPTPSTRVSEFQASTLDEDSCKAMIGEKLDGKIEKVTCDPYEYVIQETGEVIELSHRWSYVPNSQSVSMPSFSSIEEVMA